MKFHKNREYQKLIPVASITVIFHFHSKNVTPLERHFNILFATSHHLPFRYISFSFLADSFVTPKTKFLKHPAINRKKAFSTEIREEFGGFFKR